MDTETLHIIWTGIVTLLVGLILAERKHLKESIERKAEKDEVETLRAELVAFRSEQAARHGENTRRLDRILEVMLSKQHEREGP